MISKKFIGVIGSIKLKIQIILSIIFLIVGTILNVYFPLSLFYLKSILVLLILNILLYAIRRYNRNLKEIFIEASGDPVLNAYKRKFYNNIYSFSNVIASFVISIFFVLVSILLNFVCLNLLGIFSLCTLFITVFISIIGYSQYVYLINFLIKLSSSTLTNYSTFYPANTKWLSLSSRLANFYQNIFFILGSLFILLFSVFTPSNTLEIISSPYNDLFIFFPLALSWLIILIAIIIAFPVTSIIKNNSIKRIVENMKYQSIKIFEDKIVYSNIDGQLGYLGIIKEIYKSDSFPFSKKNNLIIPYLTTFLNLITVLNKIFPSIKQIFNSIQLL